jgi:Tat protein translocase TatB subunit
MNLGPAEILVILVVALVVFGPKRLPEVGRQVGGALREIRKVQDSVRSEIQTVLNDDDAPRPTPAIRGAEADRDHDDDVGAPPVRNLDEPDNGPSGSFS